MRIGLQSHGDVLPSYYDAVEVCACCGEPSKVLFDAAEGYVCGYCKEKRAEEEAGEPSIACPDCGGVGSHSSGCREVVDAA